MGGIDAEGLRRRSATCRRWTGSLDIPDGAFFVVLGPRGRKTTTLRAIAGLEKLDEAASTSTASTPPAPRRRRATWPWSSRATRSTRRRPSPRTSPPRFGRDGGRGRYPDAVDRVAELLHIERLLERKPASSRAARCSGSPSPARSWGAARVLMDEPLTNLDLKLRVEMRTELTRIHRSLGGTFLYVTNDQVEALSMADRIAVLRRRGPTVRRPAEIYERPVNRWVAGFVGSPRINLLPCQPQGSELVGEHGWTLPRPPWATGEVRAPAAARRPRRGPPLERGGESATLGGELYALEPLGDGRPVRSTWAAR